MNEQVPGKLLTVKHDGKIFVSGYGSFQLGDRSLSDIIGEAMGLDKTEYQELNAEVVVTIKVKEKNPKVWWNEC